MEDNHAAVVEAVDSSGLVEIWETLDSTYGVANKVKSVGLAKELGQAIKGLATPVMEALEAAPLVAPVARLAMSIVRTAAEAADVRERCQGLDEQAVIAVQIVVQAGKAIVKCDAALASLQSALADAKVVVEEVRGRTFLGRLFKAGSDAEGIKETGEKIQSALGALTAAVSAEMGEGVKVLNAKVDEVLAIVGRQTTGKELQETLKRHLGDDITEERLQRALGDEEVWKEVFSKLSTGEQVIAGQVKGVRQVTDQILEHVMDKTPEQIKNLPRQLFHLWTERLRLHVLTAPWPSFKRLLPRFKVSKSGRDLQMWYDTELVRPSLADFVDNCLAELLAPEGTKVDVTSLHLLAVEVEESL